MDNVLSFTVVSVNEIHRYSSLPVGGWVACANQLCCGMSACMYIYDVTYQLLVFLPCLEHLFIRKTDPIHALQTVVVGITEPVGGGVSRSGKGLDFPRVGNMWPTTEINQITATIDRSTTSIGHFGGQDGNLEWIVSKEF